MSLIKQFLTLTALLGAVFMPKPTYTQTAAISGATVAYVGVTAVVAYIFYSWGQQTVSPEKAQQNAKKALSEVELQEAVRNTFKAHIEDPFADYLDVSQSAHGYHLYLQEDQAKMVALFENIRVFLADNISDLIFLDILLCQLDELEKELKAELAISRDYVDPEFAQYHGARAARAEHYTQACQQFIAQVPVRLHTR